MQVKISLRDQHVAPIDVCRCAGVLRCNWKVDIVSYDAGTQEYVYTLKQVEYVRQLRMVRGIYRDEVIANEVYVDTLPLMCRKDLSRTCRMNCANFSQSPEQNYLICKCEEQILGAMLIEDMQ